MKVFTKLLYIILPLVFTFFLYTLSNPIAVSYFSELTVDQQNYYNWHLELEGDFHQELDGWYLTSSTDTAQLKDNLSTDYGLFLVLTQDSLLDSLAINAKGDWITLYDSLGNNMDILVFGNYQYSFIVAPKERL